MFNGWCLQLLPFMHWTMSDLVQPLAVRRNRSLAALGPLIRHQMQKTSPSDEALASLFTTLETVPATPLS